VRRDGGTCRAFTLVELLVAIGVIALLIGLLLPALASVRGSARETVCVANLRGAAQSFEMYRNRYDDRYPFGLAGTPVPVTPDGAMSVSYSRHWELARYWPSLLMSVAPWESHFAAWVCPGSPRARGAPWRLEDEFGGGVGVPSYAYSNSFIARPRLWDGRATADEKLIAPTRGGEVRSASGKVLLFDAERAHATAEERGAEPAEQRTPVVFVDGHADVRARGSAETPVANPLRGGEATLFHDTANGVFGREF